MDRLLSMRTFAHVVDEGSFAAAARRLDLNQAVVTRLVADLESHLGARLLNRTTRSLGLTEAGEAYLNRCRQILADVDQAEEMVGAGATRVAGRVRVAVPVVFGLEVMSTRLPRFRQAHPDVVLDVELIDRPVDPIVEGFDLAIVPAAYGISNSLIARPLAEKPIILAASTSYLAAAGTPRVPNDLLSHAFIGYSQSPWRERLKLSDTDGRPANVAVNNVLQSNNFALIRNAVRDGLGIGVLLQYTIEDDLAAGRLQHVLPEWHVGTIDLNLVYPSREYMPRRVRAVIDFIFAERDAMSAESPTARRNAGNGDVEANAM